MKEISACSKIKVIPNAIVDDDLYPLLSKLKWNVTKKKGAENYYYHTRLNGKWVKMHSLIIGAISGQSIDHINHITYDNRKSNLRIVSNSVNAHNRQKLTGTSRFKGVYKRGARWRSTIRFNHKSIDVGTFDSEIEAASAYDKKAVELFGEYASTNF